MTSVNSNDIIWIVNSLRIQNEVTKGVKQMTKIMTVRPTEEMHRDMKAAAKKRGLTLNALVIHIFDSWLKKEERSGR